MCAASSSSSLNPIADTYSHDFVCPGRVYIFNNKFFKNVANNRSGSERDVKRLNNIFDELNYDVIVYLDKTSAEMRKSIREMEKYNYSKVGSLIVFIMSHGVEGRILATDDEELYLTDFIDTFKEIESLKNKPKMFFVNACRGEGYMPVQHATDNTTSRDLYEASKTPIDADFLYAYSTVANYYSIRHEKNGSWFIQILCDMIDEFKSSKDIGQILVRTNNRVSEKESRDRNNNLVKMMSTFTSQLKKDFYFATPNNVNIIFFKAKEFLIQFKKHFKLIFLTIC